MNSEPSTTFIKTWRTTLLRLAYHPAWVGSIGFEALEERVDQAICDLYAHVIGYYSIDDISLGFKIDLDEFIDDISDSLADVFWVVVSGYSADMQDVIAEGSWGVSIRDELPTMVKEMHEEANIQIGGQ